MKEGRQGVASGSARAAAPRRGLSAWLRAIDPPIYVVGLMPPLVGATATLSSPSPLPFWAWAVATVAFLLIHGAVNVFNDAFDAATPADRFKRHSMARLASVWRLLLAASVLLTLACVAGIALWLRVGGWQVVALSAAGVALVFLYHAPPFRLSHRGWGEVVTFLGFGAVPVWTTAALASGEVPAAAWWPGVLMGLAAAHVLYAHNVASRGNDLASGKRTVATRMPAHVAAAASALLLTGTTLSALGWASHGWTNACLGVLLIGAPLAVAVGLAGLAAVRRPSRRWTGLTWYAAVAVVLLSGGWSRAGPPCLYF